MADRLNSTAPTARQIALASRVRTTLEPAGVRFRERLEAGSGEPVYEFDIATNPTVALEVRVLVVDDAFEFNANGARIRIVGDDPATWADESIRVLKAVLGAPLRIRVMRTWFGRIDGAVWVPDERGGGTWNGALPACRGKGDEMTFTDWLGPSA